MPDIVRNHRVTLQGKRVRLRPLTEDDREILFKWANDPEILYFSEGDHVTSRTLEEVQHIYRTISEKAHCFVIEFAGVPVGDCWLQMMNLPRVFEKYPDWKCLRIDLEIGEKRYWDGA